MGFWGALWDAAAEANESAHGERLKSGLASALSCMGALDDRVRAVAIAKFLDKRDKLKQHMPNWSRDGRIKMGRTLQEEARKCYDLNQAESYGLWLAGAWIESGERQSAAAEYVHLFLEEVADGSEAVAFVRGGTEPWDSADHDRYTEQIEQLSRGGWGTSEIVSILIRTGCPRVLAEQLVFDYRNRR